MSKRPVFCIATSRSQANRIVDQLVTANFPKDDIYILFPEKQVMRDILYLKKTKALEGAAIGVRWGGVVGCALGWIAGIGALTIPGVGPLKSVGAILAVLSGAVVGATIGGLVGALIGLCIPEAGIHLISVHTEDSDEIVLAKDIFIRAGAKDIRTLGEAATPNDFKFAERPTFPSGPALGQNHTAEQICSALSDRP